MVLVHPEYANLILNVNDLKEEIASLIVERDFCFYFICDEIQIDYMLKVGALEYNLLYSTNRHQQNVRKLELIEEKIEKNKKVDISAIEKKVKTEFKNILKIEERFSKEIDMAIEATSLEPYDYNYMEQMNMDYYKLQKLYNPVFDLKNSEERIKFYKKIEKYYRKFNYKKIHKLAEQYDENDIFQDEIQNLQILQEKYKSIVQMCQSQIVKLRNSFPYNQRLILEDDNLLRRKKDGLNKKIASVEEENKKVEKKIDRKLKKLKELP